MKSIKPPVFFTGGFLIFIIKKKEKINCFLEY